MKKINEFINNDDSKLVQEFEILEKELYYETAHLSSTYQIEQARSFKKILLRGHEFLPFLMFRILDEGKRATSYILLCQQITGGIPVKKENEGIREKAIIDYKIWWEENKYKYV